VELKVGVGRLLATREKSRRGEQTLFAELLGVSPRTLRKWRAQAADPPVMGRPRLAEETWRAAVIPVARAWQSQGFSSGLPRISEVLERLGLKIPVSIVRELLRELKARRKRYLERRRAQERQHVKVHARDAMWSQDATHMGRDLHADKIEALEVKDVATTSSIEPSIGGVATGADVLALLVRAKLVRGTLPLVLAMDNGPANRNELVCSYLRAERVIVLWNVPYTPEHNAWIESQHGELKLELEALGALEASYPSSGPTLRSHLGKRVSRVVRVLNARVRPSRGGCTAAQLDSSLPRAEDLVDRDRFYDTACAAIRNAVLGIDDVRARRRAEREAILCTLEQFGLVTRTRGRRPASCSRAVRLS
jgi:hypothetical protein